MRDKHITFAFIASDPENTCLDFESVDSVNERVSKIKLLKDVLAMQGILLLLRVFSE